MNLITTRRRAARPEAPLEAPTPAEPRGARPTPGEHLRAPDGKGRSCSGRTMAQRREDRPGAPALMGRRATALARISTCDRFRGGVENTHQRKRFIPPRQVPARAPAPAAPRSSAMRSRAPPSRRRRGGAAPDGRPRQSDYSTNSDRPAIHRGSLLDARSGRPAASGAPTGAGASPAACRAIRHPRGAARPASARCCRFPWNLGRDRLSALQLQGIADATAGVHRGARRARRRGRWWRGRSSRSGCGGSAC